MRTTRVTPAGLRRIAEVLEAEPQALNAEAAVLAVRAAADYIEDLEARNQKLHGELSYAAGDSVEPI